MVVGPLDRFDASIATALLVLWALPWWVRSWIAALDARDRRRRRRRGRHHPGA